MKIVLVAPYPQMAKDAEEICRTYGERIEVIQGRMEEGVKLGKQAVEAGAGVVISRGGTWVRLSQTLCTPVVEIAVTPYDVLRALQRARNLGSKFGIAGFINVIGSMSEWGSMLKVPVVPIEIQDDTEQTRRSVMKAIQREKVNCLLGDTTILEYSKKVGVPCVLIESGKEAIWEAIQQAKRIVAARMVERKVHASLHSVLDKVNQGILVVDEYVVQFANQTVLQLIGRDSCAGLSTKDCLPPTLFEFLQMSKSSGRDSDVLQLGAKLWFVERHPLLNDGRFFTTLHPVDDIESIERKVRERRASTGHVARYTFDDIYGQSRAMRFVIERAIHFAQADSSVLIVGETGTGKEMLAQSIHNSSSRSQGPFVAVNCAALPEQLLESELFGYEDGAFTGAKRGGKPGLFELAHSGTIFLDEIGETSLHVQQRLLRVLQERQVMRIGGERNISVNVRVIAATNQPLWEFVKIGNFRKDLFFRLDVLRLNTVPLRDRREDIPELVERILYQMWYKKKGVGVRPYIDPAVFPRLRDYYWPGNVRELENMIDYLLATQISGRIETEDIDEWIEQKALSPIFSNLEIDTLERNEGGLQFPTSVNLVTRENTDPNALNSPLINWACGRTMEEIERWAIEQTLAETGGDMTRAAQILGVSRTTLWRKVKQWQINSGSGGTNLA